MSKHKEEKKGSSNWRDIFEKIKKLSSSKQRKLFRQLKKLVKKGGKKRKANPALLKEMKCSKELQALIGKKQVNRGKMMKGVWDYIKKHKLQDKSDKRTIRADKDSKLAAVLGKKPINMFKMTAALSKHLTKIK